MVKQSFTQNEIPWLSESDCWERWRAQGHLPGPFLVYNSWLKGWTDSAAGLIVGLDDHGFHRGDGVFEALRGIGRKPYLLREHFARMQVSQARIGIEYAIDFNGLEKIIQAGLQRFPEEHSLVRLFLTRGPGGFSTDPRESLGAVFHVAIMGFKAVHEDRYARGVRTGRSQVEVKASWMATTKSLNYLPNVMMKREAVARNLDFVLSFDENGNLAESSTENIVVMTEDGHLAFPRLDRILSGCTMLRLFDLVESRRLAPTRREANLSERDLRHARGAWMVGTTLDVLPVSEYEGQAIPVHPLSPQLRDLIRQDQISS